MNRIDNLAHMILINGLSPELDLGIEWEKDPLKAVMLCTFVDGGVHLLGNMLLNVENLSKIKSFNWKYLVKPNEGQWSPKELDWESIPRTPIEPQELVKIQLKVGDADEDDLLF